jgi:LmbE family N-acetylglucosaminyl deacetylase
MFKKLIFFSISIFLLVNFVCPLKPALSSEIKELEPIKDTDRVLILAPHPDDEVIGCAGIIQEAVRVGADIHIAYLTNGDHNQVAFIVYEKRFTLRRGEFIHMGEVRRKEATKAAEVLGLSEKNLIFLGYPDFGTFSILNYYWQDIKSYRSFLTRISAVPYKNNLSFRAPYKGESILYNLEEVLLEYKPNKIFVSHPADANVDHKALYLFTEIALGDLKEKIGRPKVYPYLVHCLGWPLPKHYHPELKLDPPKQLQDSPIQWRKFTLTPEQLKNKHQAILCHKSQTESSAFYLLSFVRQNELFGDYPSIDLSSYLVSLNKTNLFLAEVFNHDDNLESEDSPDVIASTGRVSYALGNNCLVIYIDKKKEAGYKLSGLVYIFGYSKKTAFAQMPKIRILTKGNKFKIFDGRKIVDPKGASLEYKRSELILKIPLKILGDPDFILIAVKTHSGILRTDTSAFRKINLR